MTENRRVEALLFALALAPRLLYLAIARSPFENYNWNLAGSLLTDGSLSIGGVKTTAFEPLYPLFLAASRFVTGDRWVGVQAIQCALGAAGAVLLYRLAVTLTGRPRVGIAAATLYAIYPLMVRYAVNISDATLMTVLVLAFALEFTGVETRARAARAGAWLGLMMLTRAMTLPLVCSSVLLWRAGRRQGAAVFTATALLVAAPYGLRNYALNGWMLPTRGGLNLFLSNCLYTARLMPDFGLDLLEDYAHQMLERRVPAVGVPSPRLERMEDKVYTQLALEHMESDPAGTIRMRLLSAWYFFSPTLVPYHDPTVDSVLHLDTQGGFWVEFDRPRPIVDRVVYTASYVPVAALALAGIWIRRRTLRVDAVLWTIVAAFVVVHAIYPPVTRYRIPIEPVALFYSAVAIDALVSRRDVRRSMKSGSDTNQPA